MYENNNKFICRQRNSDSDTIVSLLFYIVDYETYVLTLTRDAHLKFWSCSKGQCVAVIDVREKTADNSKDRVQGGKLILCLIIYLYKLATITSFFV